MGRARETEYTNIGQWDVVEIRERSVCFAQEGKREVLWLPTSQLHEETRDVITHDATEVDVLIPTWLARERGLD